LFACSEAGRPSLRLRRPGLEVERISVGDIVAHRLPAFERQIDLIATMDDATSEIYSGFFVDEEGTASSFRTLGEVIGQKGLFCALYTDRGSHYFHTPKAGKPVDKTKLTQLGPALAQLGIRAVARIELAAPSRRSFSFIALRMVCFYCDRA
jgi:hypothetical protein